MANSGPTTLLLDNFTDASPTDITTRPMTIGGNWTGTAGQFTASGGLCHDTHNGNPDLVTGQANTANATVTCPITLSSDVGLVVRGVDSGNYLLLRVMANAIDSFTVIGGASNQIGHHVVAWSGGATHTLGCQCVGNNLNITLDGSAVATDSTAQFNTATRFGLWANSDLVSTFGTFRVTSP